MQTKAIRLYGKRDLRLEEFTLPELREDEILAEVYTDSLCMSTLKAVNNGEDHRKVPADIKQKPIIVGHEFCGKLLKIGKNWQGKYREGERFVIQPNIGDPLGYAPGYSFPYVGGDATRVIFPAQVMQNGSLLTYQGDSYFEGSLVEPLSCVVGAFRTNYHLENPYSHQHVMGIRPQGTMALLGATGPMGFLAIDLALHGDKRPKTLIVTGHTQAKLDLAAKLYPPQEAASCGVKLHYINTQGMDDFEEIIKAYTPERAGFDDIFVFVAQETLTTQAIHCLAHDGCLNFFAGPLHKDFSAPMNFFDVHYNTTHIVGNSGGNTEDMQEAIRFIERRRVQVNKIVSHVMGLSAAVQATLHLREMSPGKKVVYTHENFPCLSVKEIADGALGEEMSALLKVHHGFWSAEAERHLLHMGEQERLAKEGRS